MDSKAQATSPVYYAFISYSRKDVRAARYIQKGLENFCYTSIPVRDKYKPRHPKFLRKIFRDKTDLSYKTPNYRQGLKLALDNSRYLIVICSGNSRRSKEVEHEIQDFLSNPNHNESHVIPVVLNGHVGKKDNPLPRSLDKPEFVMRNLPVMRPEINEREKEAWESALSGIIAYMTKVPREYIYNRFLSEKRRKFAHILQWVSAVIICMLGLTCWAFHERNKATIAQTLAETERDKAESAKTEAERERDRAESERERAERERDRAEQERARAETEKRKAMALFDAGADFSENIILDFNKELSYFSRATKLQQQLFSYMESYLNSIQEQNINTPKLLRLIMLTNFKLGDNASNQGKDEKALNFLRNAQQQAEHLLALSPDDLSIQEYMVHIRHYAARIYTMQGKLTQAEQHLTQALEISKKIVQADPANMRKRTPLCESYKYLGELLQRQNKPAEAIKMYIDLLNQEENRVADLSRFSNLPTDDFLDFRLSLASACHHLASALAQSGEYSQAALVCNRGQRTISEIISDCLQNKYDNIKKDSPVIFPFLRLMATMLEQNADLGIELQLKTGNTKFNHALEVYDKNDKAYHNFALSDYEAALKTREELSQNDPFNITFKLELAYSYDKAGKGCLKMEDVSKQKAIDFLKKANQLFLDIANSNTHNSKLQEPYFRHITDLARTYINMNSTHAAIITLEQKLEYLKNKERDLLEHPNFYVELRKTYQFLGETYLRTDNLDDAQTMFEKCLNLLEEVEKSRPSANELSLSLCTIHNSLAYLYAKDGRFHEASELYKKAYPILKQAADKDPNNKALHQGLAMAKTTRALLDKDAVKAKQAADTLKQVKSIPPPPSLKGCGIKFDRITLEPDNFDIKSYEVKDNKALVLISCCEEQPKDYFSCLLSGARTTKEWGKRIPAEIVFTAKKGRVYTGYVNGSWLMSRIYHYEETKNLLPLRNCKIEITLPEEGTILEGKIAAPPTIPKKSRIEIKTDRRTLKYVIGDYYPAANILRYIPEGNIAKIDLSLPLPDNCEDPNAIFMELSGTDDFKKVFTFDASKTLILFMEKTGKTYRGVFRGYLYFYKRIPIEGERYEKKEILLRRETLQSITISLP